VSSIAHALLHVQVSTATHSPSPDVVLSTVYLTGRARTLLKYGARKALFQEKRVYPPHQMILTHSVVDAFTNEHFQWTVMEKKLFVNLLANI
jgi:hypothetical protein